MNTAKTETGGREIPRVDWASMTDAQLGWQADCFELHGEKIPTTLRRELDKRCAQSYDSEGSVYAMRRSERIVGA